jgi:predicted ATPase
VRALLEHLAQTRPLVLVLDDFHWADPASVELLGALVRRPPAAAVLTAAALRPHQTPERLAPAIAASLSEELTLLSDGGRLVLEGAAVAGDPFEPVLAAAAAAISEAAAMDAVDELLELDLVRTTDVPRRFRFRHPLVRRAVYEATACGWRLRAHERCAEALAARGVKAAGRAHHVERSAREGDVAAVAVLRDAGEEVARLAPESAAQ